MRVHPLPPGPASSPCYHYYYYYYDCDYDYYYRSASLVRARVNPFLVRVHPLPPDPASSSYPRSALVVRPVPAGCRCGACLCRLLGLRLTACSA